MTDKVFDYLRYLTAGLLLLALVSAPVACTVHRDHKLSEMVKAGADPQDARCAMALVPADHCILFAVRGK